MPGLAKREARQWPAPGYGPCRATEAPDPKTPAGPRRGVKARRAVRPPHPRRRPTPKTQARRRRSGRARYARPGVRRGGSLRSHAVAAGRRAARRLSPIAIVHAGQPCGAKVSLSHSSQRRIIAFYRLAKRKATHRELCVRSAFAHRPRSPKRRALSRCARSLASHVALRSLAQSGAPLDQAIAHHVGNGQVALLPSFGRSAGGSCFARRREQWIPKAWFPKAPKAKDPEGVEGKGSRRHGSRRREREPR